MKNLSTLIILLSIVACSTSTTEGDSTAEEESVSNPPAEGFNAAESDKEAIAIADEVMEAMGGRSAWDETRYLCWKFFNSRELLWDKQTGKVRIESARDTSVYLMNVNSMEGRFYKNGEEITDPEEIQKRLERGKNIWINDSYWLVMPFKLKDSGVTLKYLREDTTQAGVEADVLQLTFEDVGVTPQNKYELWVDKSDRLIKQWAYFREASQDSASSIWPWDNYKQYGSLLMSSDRSDGRGPNNLVVTNEIDEEKFTDPNKRIRD